MRKDLALTAMIHGIGRRVADGLVQPLVAGVVHEASDSSLELQVAVVVTRPQFRSGSGRVQGGGMAP
jgi:hypothetical protein